MIWKEIHSGRGSLVDRDSWTRFKTFSPLRDPLTLTQGESTNIS